MSSRSIPPFFIFLEQKPLYYKKIDYTRIHKAYALLKPHLKRPKIVVHIVGTNGKGSTGTILTHLAQSGGLSVGHYTSPHLLRFNERIKIDGKEIEDEVLEQLHQRLFAILGKTMSEALSYFEYTTLITLLAFEECELAVLEAGLGGEHDATNVVDKNLSIFTAIGYDHQAFLGERIEEIAATKLRSMQKIAVLAKQPYKEVEAVATKIAAQKGATLLHAKELPTKQQQDLLKIAKQIAWPTFLIDNAKAALKAIEVLGIEAKLASLKSLKLFGRLYPYSKNVLLDVGHNPLAAQAIVPHLKPQTTLIYNVLDDKDIDSVLEILKPKIAHLELIPIDTPRRADEERIKAIATSLGIQVKNFRLPLSKDCHYLVFGSFYTVEAFLKRMQAQ